MQNSRRKIIVSGGSGFTGRHLSKLLADQGYDIYFIKRGSNVNLVNHLPSFYEIDLNSYDEVASLYASNEIAAVIHLATVYTRRENPSLKELIWEANFHLGKRMLELAVASKAHFLHVESYFQYEELMQTEYLKSKIAFSKLVDNERDKNRIGITSLIFFDNYGFGDNRNKIINQLIVARIEAKSIQIEDLNRVIILTSIIDVASAIVSSIRDSDFGRYRVNSTEKYYLWDLCRFIIEFPNVGQPERVLNRIYNAEAFPNLRTFFQTMSLVDYINSMLSNKTENGS